MWSNFSIVTGIQAKSQLNVIVLSMSDSYLIGKLNLLKSGIECKDRELFDELLAEHAWFNYLAKPTSLRLLVGNVESHINSRYRFIGQLKEI